MKSFSVKKGYAGRELIAYLLLCDAIMFILFNIIEGYIETRFIGLVIFFFTIWCIYYIVLNYTITYQITDDEFIINLFWGIKKIRLNFTDINGFLLKEEYIDGFKMYGIGKNKYAFGKMVVKGVGSTRAFVTNPKKIIYLHTEGDSYAISPSDIDGVLEILFSKNIPIKEFETKVNIQRDLFKNKRFVSLVMITFIVISSIIIVPFLLYLLSRLPGKMPLIFDATFKVVMFGSGKEFAIRQMILGIGLIIIFICIYYTSYFIAKYDVKIAIRYMYIPFIISLLMAFIQLQILINYL
ncbi:MAG: PH domain-containing protein [Sarcina sp.]